MKKILKTLSIALCIIMCINMSGLSVYASKKNEQGDIFKRRNTSKEDRMNQEQIEKKQEVEKLLDELGLLYAQEELNKTKSVVQMEDDLVETQTLHRMEKPISKASRSATEVATELNQLKEKLFKMGVEEVSQGELNKYNAIANEDEKTSPLARVSVPKGTKSLKWYKFSYTYTKNGTKYSIDELYAQAIGGNTSLAGGCNGKQLYTKQQYAVNAKSILASIYVQKAIGQVKSLAWTPYELLFMNDRVVANSHVITCRYLSKVCFSYVKKSSQSDNKFRLSYISNSVSYASSHVHAGYKKGKPFSKSYDASATESAINYASATSALNAYLNPRKDGQPTTSYVSKITFYSPDKKKSCSLGVSNPDMPSKVW